MFPLNRGRTTAITMMTVNMKKVHPVGKMSIGDLGGEEKFRRGPGLVSPRRSQPDSENGGFDVRDKTPPAAAETSRLTSRSVDVAVVPSRCSRPGQKSHKAKL